MDVVETCIEKDPVIGDRIPPLRHPGQDTCLGNGRGQLLQLGRGRRPGRRRAGSQGRRRGGFRTASHHARLRRLLPWLVCSGPGAGTSAKVAWTWIAEFSSSAKSSRRPQVQQAASPDRAGRRGRWHGGALSPPDCGRKSNPVPESRRQQSRAGSERRTTISTATTSSGSQRPCSSWSSDTHACVPKDLCRDSP